MKNWKIKLTVELLGWFIAGLVALIFLLPITSKIFQYPFLKINVAFIVIFITLARYIFLLKHTFIAYNQWLKAILMIGCIPAFIYVLRLFKRFQEYLAEKGVEHFMNHLPYEQQVSLGKYVTAEMLFFGAAALISILVFALRMMVSIWRLHNRGTV